MEMGRKMQEGQHCIIAVTLKVQSQPLAAALQFPRLRV
jgi:hypothetical protein